MTLDYKVRRQRIPNREMSPARQVRWLEDHPTGNVHRARSSQSDGEDFIVTHAMLFAERSQGLIHLGDRDRNRVVDPSHDLGRADRTSPIVDQTDLYAGSTNIDTRENGALRGGAGDRDDGHERTVMY